MNFDDIEAYLTRLASELRKRGVIDARIVEEARGHLADGAEQGIQRGLTADVAQREAISRFGSPRAVAAHFVSERYRWLDRLLFGVAVVLGLAIAYVDSRPNGNDPGLTAFLLCVAPGVLAVIAPRRPWLWAIAIGTWIPFRAAAGSSTSESLAMLMLPFAGAYAGIALRRVHGMLTSSAFEGDGHFHDKPGRFHFAIMSRRGWVNPELLAIVVDPGTHLIPFVERVVPPPLGPLGKLHSLTVVDVGSTRRRRKYQVVFGEEGKITCTVTIDTAGRGVSIDWFREERPGEFNAGER